MAISPPGSATDAWWQGLTGNDASLQVCLDAGALKAVDLANRRQLPVEQLVALDLSDQREHLMTRNAGLRRHGCDGTMTKREQLRMVVTPDRPKPRPEVWRLAVTDRSRVEGVCYREGFRQRVGVRRSVGVGVAGLSLSGEVARCRSLGCDAPSSVRRAFEVMQPSDGGSVASGQGPNGIAEGQKRLKRPMVPL